MNDNKVIGGHDDKNTEYNYMDIYRKLRQDIEGKVYIPGTKLPAESQLSAQFGINRFAVRKAFQKLIADGLVITMRNRGYYVLPNEINVRIRKNSNYTQSMLDKKMTPKVKVLGIKTANPDEEQKKLFQLPDSGMLWELHILRYYKNIPYVISKSYIPYDRFLKFGFEFEKHLSIFKVFGEIYGVKASRKSSVCTATKSDKKESRLLSVFEHSPLLKVSSVNVDQDNRPIEQCISSYRSDMVRLSINLQML